MSISTRHKNRGRFYDRTKHNPLEKALADGWEKENVRRPNVNLGQGILQDLFIERGDHVALSNKLVHRITDDERMVAATVVQWLGTNCGRCFLEECLRECGYEITKNKKKL